MEGQRLLNTIRLLFLLYCSICPILLVKGENATKEIKHAYSLNMQFMMSNNRLYPF